MPASEQDVLRELFFEYHLLVVRRQRLTEEQHARICSYLGPIPTGSRDDPAVHVISTEGALGSGRLVFHSDLAFDETPHVGVSLHALKIEPEECTSTDFVSGVEAAQSLPSGLRSKVEDLRAVHVFPIETARRSTLRPSEEFPSASHPVLMPHPVTGVSVLFVAEQATVRLEGVGAGESDRLLGKLFDHLYRPEVVYRHRWRTGDVIFWDNVALQHGRGPQEGVGERTLQRVTIARESLRERYGEFMDAHAEDLARVAHSASQSRRT